MASEQGAGKAPGPAGAESLHAAGPSAPALDQEEQQEEAPSTELTDLEAAKDADALLKVAPPLNMLAHAPVPCCMTGLLMHASPCNPTHNVMLNPSCPCAQAFFSDLKDVDRDNEVNRCAAEEST